MDAGARMLGLTVPQSLLAQESRCASRDQSDRVKRKELPGNLISETWTDLDLDELRLVLRERFGPGLGQYDGEDGKLYLPLARAQSRIALTYEGSEIVAVEPGQAFDAAEWGRVSQEIEHSIRTGTRKTGRDYSFSSFPVRGSWRGARSGVQILPAHESAPRAAGASHPFILEFPITGSDLWFITNHRRIREHRKLTLLLNVLLAGRTTCLSQRPSHFWANVPPDEGERWPNIKWVQELFHQRIVHAACCWLAKLIRWPPVPSPNIKWVQEWYFAPLDHPVLDEPSPPAAEQIEEIEPDTKIFNDGRSLQVPTDLDESICHYLDLSTGDKAKFDRAAFWLDMSSRQWTISASATFAACVSAIEALIRGRGATQRFKAFIEAYAPGASLASQRGEIYDLRSGILHGSELIELDYALAFGWDPPWLNQQRLIEDLSTITRIALRKWLKSPSTPPRRR